MMSSEWPFTNVLVKFTERRGNPKIGQRIFALTRLSAAVLRIILRMHFAHAM